jgi:predicted peptidase
MRSGGCQPMNRSLLTAGMALLIVLSAGCRKKTPADLPPAPVPDAEYLKALGPGTHRETANFPGGSTFRYTLTIPKNYDGKKKLPLIVALHYGGPVRAFYGGSMVDVLVGPAFEEMEAIIAAPDVRSNKKDWTAPENEVEVVWFTNSLIKTYAIDPKKVLLTGYSMGGQGTWFIGGRHQDLFTALIVMAGSPMGNQEVFNIPVYVIHSRSDQTMPLVATQGYVNALKARGSQVELKVVSGYKHEDTKEFTTPLRSAVVWLKKTWGEK